MRADAALAVGVAAGIAIGAAVTQRWGGDLAGFVRGIPQPVATIIGTIAGFGVVAWQARIALRAIIAGQNHRAKIEEKGRRDQDRIERQRQVDDRAYEKAVLAAALFGELSAMLHGVMNTAKFMKAQKGILEAAARDRDLASLQTVPTPRLPVFRVPVFEANIAKLGTLGASIAGDVAAVYAKAIIADQPQSDAKLTPQYAAKMAEILSDFLSEWTWEILQVNGRLLYLQGLGQDPGHIGDEAAKSAFRNRNATRTDPT